MNFQKPQALNMPSNFTMANDVGAFTIAGVQLGDYVEDALKGQADNTIVVQRNFDKEVKNNSIHNGAFQVITQQGMSLNGESFAKNQVSRVVDSKDIKNSSGPIATYNTAQAIDPNVIEQLKPQNDFAELCDMNVGEGQFLPETKYSRISQDDFGLTGITEDMYFTSGDNFRATKALQQKTDSFISKNRYIAFGVETNFVQDAESRARSANYQQGALLEKYYAASQKLAHGIAMLNEEMNNVVLFGSKATSNVGSLIKPIVANGDASTTDSSTMIKDLDKMTIAEFEAFITAQMTQSTAASGLNAEMVANTIIMDDEVLRKLKLKPVERLVGTSGSIGIQYFYDILEMRYNAVLSSIGEKVQIIGRKYLKADNVNRYTSEGSVNLYIFTRRRQSRLMQDGIFYNLPIAPALLNTLMPVQNTNGIIRTDIVFAQIGQVIMPRGKMHFVYKPAA